VDRTGNPPIGGLLFSPRFMFAIGPEAAGLEDLGVALDGENIAPVCGATILSCGIGGSTIRIGATLAVRRCMAPLGKFVDRSKIIARLRRAMVAAKLANLEVGKPNPANLRNNVSQSDAAEMLNVSPRTVDRARKGWREANSAVRRCMARLGRIEDQFEYYLANRSNPSTG